MEADFHESEALGGSRDGNQSVYIYQPPKQPKAHDERPSKRRKVLPENLDQEADALQFVPLLNGDENVESIQSRYTTYKQLWADQEGKIQRILEDVDSEVLESVSTFVQTTSSEAYNGCIPTALVTVGSNVSSLSRLLSRLNGRLTASGEGGVVVLESGDAHNLKTALKNIIRGAVTNTEGNDGYQKFLTDRAGPRLLAYDLDLLSDYTKRKGVSKLVLALRDSEAFDSALMMDLLSLLSSWLDRIPFVLLLGISTSVEIFESRLPRSSVALLQGKHFEIHEAGDCVDRIYDSLQAEKDSRLWLGRNITGVLFEKSNDYFQSPEAFSRTVKYAYMSHFFANPLAVLLAKPVSSHLQRDKTCEAIRNIPSFRRFCEDLLDSGSSKQVRDLLENDGYLLEEALKHLKAGQQKMRNIFQAVKIIRLCLQKLQLSKKNAMADLSIRALSGELKDSSTLDDVLTAVRKLDSENLKELLASLPVTVSEIPQFRKIQEDLQSLIETYKGTEPLRSEYDTRHSVVQTTVVKQQVRLSKGKARLPRENLDYTEIVDRLYAASEAYFTETLVRPQDLLLHEVFLFDFRNPLKETFAPRPRFAIERALAAPFDYLISSSQATGSRISAKQPATAILYQLYLESGALVNVADLWHAFYSVFESADGDTFDERLTMALFYRALSELKALGLVKSSRKKIDHIAKSAWLGL